MKRELELAGRAPAVGIAVLIVVVAGLVVDANKADEDNFYQSIIRLDNVATKLHQNYVEEVKSADLVDKAIEGMLQILDPHTSYFQKKQYEELRIHTQGKFGGLGIQISIRDKVLTVMTPISGTPASRAGIRSGDQIVKIDGKSTKGIAIDEAVAKLRGEPGTEVTLTIRRRGAVKDVDYTITREVIQIRSVPFYSLFDGGIGYLRLVAFSEETGDEVERALTDMVDEGMKGLVFDLRYNPGGLLPEAITVAEKFLPRKSLVVSTRGRVRGQNKEFFARVNPVLPKEIPMVTLVNRASASASEIVSGAIQDWDRGVVLGDTTFGKGSVQSILPLDQEHHLKLTTAFYYTPSGRCINKPENAIRGGRGDEEEEGDDEDADDEREEDTTARSDSTIRDTTTYRTKNNRIVYGGGGIIPDTIVEEEPPSTAVRMLFAKDAFFKFANIEYPKLKAKKIKVEADYEASDEVMRDFDAFLDSIEFRYQTGAGARFEEFKAMAGIVDSLADSAEEREEELGLTEEETALLKDASKNMERVLDKAAARAMGEHRDEIRGYITEALLVREFGQDNAVVYRKRLGNDLQLKTAFAILLDKGVYEGLLAPAGD
jgi:carboxyl-terminal processing protease